METKIESIGKKIFRLCGLEIKWVHPRYCAAQSIITKNSIEQNSLKTINEFYSNPKIVKEYLAPERIAFYHEAINIFHNKGIIFNQKNVADIGCGTGNLLQILSEKKNITSLTGFEYSDVVIEIAKKTCPKANFFQFDIYKGSSQKFDILFCTEVLEHLLYPDKALKNILNMIDDNGILLLTVPNGRTDIFLGHINFWSPESWKIFIEKNCKDFKYDIGIVKSSYDNYAIIQLKD